MGNVRIKGLVGAEEGGGGGGRFSHMRSNYNQVATTPWASTHTKVPVLSLQEDIVI